MTSSEKNLSGRANKAVSTLYDIQRIFQSIQFASDKYYNIEAYVVWRLAQLLDDPAVYHPFLIDSGNAERFETVETALPSDSEILATMLTALMDLCSHPLDHPRHYVDHSSYEALRSKIGNHFTNKSTMSKFVGGLVNTQPVAAINSR